MERIVSNFTTPQCMYSKMGKCFHFTASKYFPRFRRCDSPTIHFNFPVTMTLCSRRLVRCSYAFDNLCPHYTPRRPLCANKEIKKCFRIRRNRPENQLAFYRTLKREAKINDGSQEICVNGAVYKSDEWTNVTPKILSLLERKLHQQKHHPICLIKEAIMKHFYKSYTRSRDRPIFAVFDNLSPVVSTYQNFDSMLIPKDHISRKKSDNYYINSNTLLRAHTSAHESELIRSGLDAFLLIGDVYRRDAIDSTHYPAFHQLEGARLFTSRELFKGADENTADLSLFENGTETSDKQACHTLEASKLVEFALKQTLENCMEDLFEKGIESRWVDAYFPFTHPSFELEIKYEGEWMEMLGCGVLRQRILDNGR